MQRNTAGRPNDSGPDYLHTHGYPRSLPRAATSPPDTPFSLAVKRALAKAPHQTLTPPELLPLIPPSAWPPKGENERGFLALLRTCPGVRYSVGEGDRGARSVYVTISE